MPSTKKRTSLNTGKNREKKYRLCPNVKIKSVEEEALDLLPVAIERPVSINSLNFDELPQKDSFCLRPDWVDYLAREGCTVNLTLCSEFADALIPLKNEGYSFKAHIRGRDVLLNPITLGRIMGVTPLDEGAYEFPYLVEPPEPTPDELASMLKGVPSIWPLHRDNYKSFERKDLHPTFQALWLIVSHSIMPTSHPDKLSIMHARVMHAICNDRPVCLVRFFISMIASCMESAGKAVKMGSLITRLCQDSQIRFKPRDVKSPAKLSIDKRTLRRSLGQRNGAQIGMNQREGLMQVQERDDAEGSQTRQRKRRAVEVVEDIDNASLMSFMQSMQASIDRNFQVLTARVDDLCVAVDANRRRVDQLITDFQDYRDEVGKEFDRLDCFS